MKRLDKDLFKKDILTKQEMSRLSGGQTNVTYDIGTVVNDGSESCMDIRDRRTDFNQDVKWVWPSK